MRNEGGCRPALKILCLSKLNKRLTGHPKRVKKKGEGEGRKKKNDARFKSFLGHTGGDRIKYFRKEFSEEAREGMADEDGLTGRISFKKMERVGMDCDQGIVIPAKGGKGGGAPPR